MNFCRSCRQDFSSVRLFDAHRVGRHELDWPEHEDGRRCLDGEELEALGWQRDGRGRWFDPVERERARDAFSAMRIPSQTRREQEADPEAA